MQARRIDKPPGHEQQNDASEACFTLTIKVQETLADRGPIADGMDNVYPQERMVIYGQDAIRL
jgi:hypothetical protein